MIGSILQVPSLAGLPFGHEDDPITLPCSRLATIVCSSESGGGRRATVASTAGSPSSARMRAASAMSPSTASSTAPEASPLHHHSATTGVCDLHDQGVEYDRSSSATAGTTSGARSSLRYTWQIDVHAKGQVRATAAAATAADQGR
jgi:hypothetical protein